MARQELHKKMRWEVILLVIGCVLTAISSIVVAYLSPKDKDQKKPVPSVIISPVFNNNIISKASNSSRAQTVKKQQNQVVNTALEKALNQASENVNKYVDIYLNINSNDVVLVNGRAASADEISETPNTLKLISGHRYTIKINNCPEKEITPTKDMTISVCM